MRILFSNVFGKQNILLYTLISTICNICVSGIHSLNQKVLYVNRSVISSGLHRILQYNVTLNGLSKETQILIEEILPRDMYVDPYQLSKRIVENKFKIITDKINTEAPAYQATPLKIQFCSSSKTNFHFVELPVHLRYQKPHQCDTLGETVIFTMGAPTIYFRSSSSNYTDSSLKNLMCLPDTKEVGSWIEISTVKLETNIEVPVACTEHLYLVLFLTVSVIGLSTLYLCSLLIKENKV